jgi:hypothetical protein
VKCQQAIAKQVKRLFRSELSNLSACVDDLLRCVHVKLGDQRCLDRTRTKCTSKLAKVAAEQNRFATASTRACAALAFADLMAPEGLGYDALASECEAEFAVALDDRTAIPSCVLAKYANEVTHLIAILQPRAGELMDVVGVPVPPDLEIQSFGGNGLSFNDVATGRAIVACSAAIERRGERLATAHLRRLLKCVDRVFTCVQSKPTDPGCLARAAGVCEAELGAIGGAETTPDRRVAAKCGETVLPFAQLLAATGAHVEALAAQCAVVGVPSLDSIADYERCVVRQQRCSVEELVRFTAPRADELLRFLIQHPLRSDLCPSGGLAAQLHNRRRPSR